MADNTSRYAGTSRVLRVDGQNIPGVWRRDIRLTKPAAYRQVLATDRDAGRLDLVAYYEYGEPALWWVIAVASNIVNQFDIKAGDKLIVPSRAVVDSFLTSPTLEALT